MRLDTAAPSGYEVDRFFPNDAGSDRTLRVLMVDDDVDTRLILSRLLGKAGHDVVPVESVQGALKLLDSEQFDVLISDIGLPDSSGYELVREAKKRQPLKGIALSADSGRKRICGAAWKLDSITI